MSTEPGSFSSNGRMIVVSNRLPFVLKRNEISDQLERKARLVRLFCSLARRIRFIFQSCSSRVVPPSMLIDGSKCLFLPRTRVASRRSTIERQWRRMRTCQPLYCPLTAYRLSADGEVSRFVRF
jgi:trehalose 6-phosphate synthase/phosphatase